MNLNSIMSRGLLGAVTLLLASHVNAATISLTPSVTNVVVNEAFTLTVEGDGFNTGMSSGGVVLSWDTNFVELTSTLGDITATLPLGMFDFASFLTPADGSGIATATISAGGFSDFADGAGHFDFATLSFVAVPPPGTTNVIVSASPFGDWQDATEPFAQPVIITEFNPATVNVSAVPVPAAVWLFASGLIGLVGIARRRTPGSA